MNKKICYHQCKFFDTEGGPGPVMICTHPKAPYDGYIITHPQCDKGLPELCPLKNGFKAKTQNIKTMDTAKKLFDKEIEKIMEEI